MLTWPRGVTVSTLDSESSDRGSNPREALALNSLRPGLTDQQWLPKPHCDMSLRRTRICRKFRDAHLASWCNG